MLAKLLELLKPDVSTEAKLTGVTAVVGKEIENLDSRLKTQEIRSFIPGKQGERGEKGKDGKDGLDGKDGKPGRDGKDGKDGKPGRDGKQGVSVVDTYIAADNHLVMKLSDGKEIDAGDLPEIVGKTLINTQVAKDQIVISSIAPVNPQINDLWLQI